MVSIRRADEGTSVSSLHRLVVRSGRKEGRQVGVEEVSSRTMYFVHVCFDSGMRRVFYDRMVLVTVVVYADLTGNPFVSNAAIAHSLPERAEMQSHLHPAILNPSKTTNAISMTKCWNHCTGYSRAATEKARNDGLGRGEALEELLLILLRISQRAKSCHRFSGFSNPDSYRCHLPS